jgi:hypothetical protein
MFPEFEAYYKNFSYPAKLLSSTSVNMIILFSAKETYFVLMK